MIFYSTFQQTLITILNKTENTAPVLMKCIHFLVTLFNRLKYNNNNNNNNNNNRKEVFYLTTHSTHLVTVIWRGTCGKGSDSERGNPLLPHGILLPISSKGSFICTIPQTG